MSKGTTRVAVGLITNDQDEILMGLRNDNNKFTTPGGHLEDGECAFVGMCRELKEETGLDAKTIQLVKVQYIPHKNLMVYVFKLEIYESQTIDTSSDPDKECPSWQFMDPNVVREHLHVPLEDNILLQYWINS